MAALTATAWLALLLWGQSPYGRYLDHGSWAEIGVAGSLCRALPGGRDALTGSLVVGGWVLMLSAIRRLGRRGCRAPVGVVGRECLGDRRGHSRDRRRLSVHRAQIPLSRQMPGSARLCHRALARCRREISGSSFGGQTRRFLRRMLLVPDAADVRGRLG